MAVVRGGLTGETYVVSYDHATGKEETTILPAGCHDSFLEAAQKMPPQELAELVQAAKNLSDQEMRERWDRVESAGGRNAFVHTESERLVAEGKYQNILDARQAVVNELEIFPRSKKAENTVAQAAQDGQLPKDITETGQVDQLRAELALLARDGKLEDFTRLFPRLMRIGALDLREVAKIAMDLAKAEMQSSLGSDEALNQPTGYTIGDIQPEQATTIAQSLEMIRRSDSAPDPEQTKNIRYVWSVVARLVADSGLKSDQLPKRVI